MSPTASRRGVKPGRIRRFGNPRHSRLGSLRYGGSAKMRPVECRFRLAHSLLAPHLFEAPRLTVGCDVEFPALMRKIKSRRALSYADSGVSIDAADAAKTEMERTLATKEKRVLNSVGAFASLYDASFPGYSHPVLVLKTEEPGSKQLLAFQHDRVESICQDMVHHLINDIAVMGATPLSVQDAVICGKLDPRIIGRIVKAIAAVCREQGCVLTGGETSEQPGVIAPGTYILTSSVVGVVDRNKIIDGARIEAGDQLLGIASNGLHTNGYSLVRRLMAENPRIIRKRVGRTTFLEAILKPHTCYYRAVRGLFDESGLHGMAHITGSGIEGNLERIVPRQLDARIELANLRILPIFKTLRDEGNMADPEMLRTFNMGTGLILVAAPARAAKIRAWVKRQGHDCFPLGEMEVGSGKVRFAGKLNWVRRGS